MYDELLFSWQIHGDDGLDLRPWTWLTALLAAPPGQLLAVAWAGIVQWFLAGEVERRWGPWRYLAIVVIAGLLGELSLFGIAPLLPESLRTLPVNGVLCVQVAAVVGFGVCFPQRKVRPLGLAPIAGQWLAILLAIALMTWPLVGGLGGIVGGIAVGVSASVAWLASWMMDRKMSGPRPDKVRKASHLRVVRSADDLLN